MELWELAIIWVVVGIVSVAIAAGIIAGAIWLVVTTLRWIKVL